MLRSQPSVQLSGIQETHLPARQIEHDVEMLENLNANRAGECVFANRFGVVLGELFEVLFRSQFASRDFEVEVGEVKSERYWFPILCFSRKPCGGSVVQLEPVSSVEVKPQIDGRSHSRTGNVASQHQPPIDDLNRYRAALASDFGHLVELSFRVGDRPRE